MTNLAIIPARGGSKRIPRKNIKLFNGKPIIAYSIEAAIRSCLFESVIVSTDDEEIAAISKKYGAEVPFLRSNENADDYSGTGDVAFEVLTKLKKEGKNFDLACCIYATAPLITEKRILEAMNLLICGGFDSTFPVSKFSSSIWRSYKRNIDGKVDLSFSEYEKFRSQDLPDAYHDSGQFYWFYPSKLEILDNKNLFGINKGSIVLEEYEVQDIDNMSDWTIAELKHKFIESITK